MYIYTHTIGMFRFRRCFISLGVLFFRTFVCFDVLYCTVYDLVQLTSIQPMEASVSSCLVLSNPAELQLYTIFFLCTTPPPPPPYDMVNVRCLSGVFQTVEAYIQYICTSVTKQINLKPVPSVQHGDKKQQQRITPSQ